MGDAYFPGGMGEFVCPQDQFLPGFDRAFATGEQSSFGYDGPATQPAYGVDSTHFPRRIGATLPTALAARISELL